MYKYLYYLIQPGVVSTGLMGTAMQVGIAFANSFNVAGAADMISQYGLSGQLTSGGLIAALTGAYYSLTQRKVGQTVAAGAGAVAGGISGTLGTAITQALGWTAVAEGTTPLLNFTAITTALMGALGAADPSSDGRDRTNVRSGGADASVRLDGHRWRPRRISRHGAVAQEGQTSRSRLSTTKKPRSVSTARF